MKKRTTHNLKVLTMFIILLFPALLIAGEYTIKKGDTLWDISEEKMKDPFLWKNLWKANPYIKNPNLILPGQKLNIPIDTSEIKKEEIQEDIGLVPKKADKEIQEEIEVVPTKKAEKEIIAVKIAPKKITAQKKNYLTSKEILLQSGYISDDIKIIGKIYGSPKKKILMGRGDYVYIETEKPVNLTDKFYIIGKPEKVIHPVTEDLVGYLIRINGVLEVMGEDNGNKKALIVESYNEISSEEMLTAFYPVELPVEPDKESRPAINGTIIKIWNKYNIIGTGDIVYLDKGLANGVKIGDVFNIIASEKLNVNIGMLQVIVAKNKTSVAIVRKATNEIKTGYLFRN